MVDVLTQVKEEWEKNQAKIERRIRDWASELSEREDIVKEAREEFHQWGPLQAYTSISQARKKGAPTFSLRYRGQDVATLVLKQDKKFYVEMSERLQTVNERDFELKPRLPKSFLWNNPDGQTFRRHSKDHAAGFPPGEDCREHALESMIIREMRRGTLAKFDGMVGKIRPVLLYGRLPFQVPIPFSAVSGRPEYSTKGGNIDILARRKATGRPDWLSVWELKKPGAIAHAAFQSFIYAVTLRYMLRSSSGAAWFKLFGFKRELPTSLVIESVVVVSESMATECQRQLKELIECSGGMSIDDDRGKDRFTLSFALYEGATTQLKLKHIEPVVPY